MKTQTKTKLIAIALVILVGTAMLLGGSKNSNSNSSQQGGSNVSIVDGKQIITINARGGYSPRVTTAKADVPTAIKMSTKGTFDCSSAISIPSIGYRNNLPPSGETFIDIPPQKAGTTMQGLCAMGMYSFVINFN